MESESELDLNPQDVGAVLEAMGLTVTVLNDDASTAPLAAQALGTSVMAIAKSIVFMAGDEAILVVAAGDRKVSTSAIQRVVEGRVRLAKPEQVLRVTGYRVGGVPPVAHRQPLRTLLDERLRTLPTVYAAAGGSRSIVALTPAQLGELTRGVWLQVSEPTD